MNEPSISYTSPQEMDKYLAMTPQELAKFSYDSLKLEVSIALDTIETLQEIGVEETPDYQKLGVYLKRLQQALAMKGGFNS